MSTRAGSHWGKRKTAVLLVAVVVLAALAWYVKNHVTLAELVAHELRVREAIAERPWRSFGIGLAIYSVVSLVPGTSGKSIVFAWLFGFWQGVTMIIAGLTVAATVNFYLIDPLILVALGISAVFPFAFRWMARQLGFLKSSSAELEEERHLLSR